MIYKRQKTGISFLKDYNNSFIYLFFESYILT